MLPATKHLFASALLLVMFVSPMSAQQGSGTIIGRAADNSGAVIPGVTVTLSSPALMGTRDTVTDERGAYRFDLLPLGTYSLKFELPGFAILIREGLQITAGFTATINVALQVATQSETVTVTGQSPVVDLQNAAMAVNISPTMLANLPTARDIYGIVGMAPGIMMTKFDVGGSQTGTTLTFRVYGTDSQSYMMLDGVITADTLYADFGSVEETQVVGASKGADIRVAGASTNQIIKSGSNIFHGGMEGYWESPRLQGKNLNDALRARGLTSTNRISRYYDLNPYIGGPIKEDKLWWFFSARRNWVGVFSPGFKKGGCTKVSGCNDQPIGTFVADNPSTEDQIFFTDLPVGTAKLSYQLNLNNQFSYTGNWARKEQPYRGGFGPTAGFFNGDSAGHQAYPSWLNKGQWTAVINSGITLDTTYGTHRVHWPHVRRVNEYSRRDVDTQQVRGGYSGENIGFFSPATSILNVANTGDEMRYQFNQNLSILTDKLITGSHNLKLGYAREVDLRRSIDDGTVGQLVLYYRGGFKDTAFIETLDYPFPTMNGAKLWSGFVNDTWKVNPKLTVGLGLRLDQATSFWEKLEKKGNGPFQTPFVVPARDVVTLRRFVPRLSFIYDIFGDGKTALKASYGRYVIDPLRQLATAVNPIQVQKRRYVWDATGPAANCYLTNCSFDPTGRTAVDVAGGVNRDVGSNLKYPYTDEFTVGLDRELMQDLSLRLFVVRKFEQNRFELFNDGIPYSTYNIPVTAVDQGRDGIVGTADDKVRTLFSLDPAYVGKRQDVLRNNPSLDNANTVLEATLVKRFSNKWQMLAGWDYLFRKVWTSDYGGISSDTSGIPENPNSLLYNAGQHFGTWHARASGTYDAPYGLKLSATYRAAKGDAYGRRWNTPRMNQGVQVLTVEPVGTFFMDTVKLLDVRAEKTFTVSERWGRVGMIFDWFNLMNSAAVTAVNDLTGAAFQQPTRTIEPRIARLGLRYTF